MLNNNLNSNILQIYDNYNKTIKKIAITTLKTILNFF